LPRPQRQQAGLRGGRASLLAEARNDKKMNEKHF